MRRQAIPVLVFALGLMLQAAAFAGGFKCPPRFGVIAASSSGGDVVFIDAADDRAYQINATTEARSHVGHRVKIVAHVLAGSTDTLYVHTLQCLDRNAH